MRVLIACEFSGTVRTAFRALGHDAWSCDFEPAEDGSEYHIIGDAGEAVKGVWDLLIAHPPCTYLTNAGSRHLDASVESVNGRRAKVSGTARFEAVAGAAAFFNLLKNASVPRIAIENPIPHKYARALIGDYTQLIQPWQFGHGERKATCLWLKNLPPLDHTELCIGREPTAHMTPGHTGQAKIRSRTYPGVAVAMASQWGGYALQT
jgi:hypothetical protein